VLELDHLEAEGSHSTSAGGSHGGAGLRFWPRSRSARSSVAIAISVARLGAVAQRE
jgi:hypothetical protein